jgi:lysophospholipase L1-like esterase
MQGMRLTVLLSALALVSGCRHTPLQVSAHEPEVGWSGGRVERGDKQGPWVAWSGTTLAVRFTGTSLGVRLIDGPKRENPGPNRFRVSVDGGPWFDLYVSQAPLLYRVAEGLTEGEHLVRLERETEPIAGETQVLGLELDPGARLLPAPPPPSRRLEFIGDSNVTGFGIEGANESCSYSTETQRISLTYAALTAQSLQAEAHIVAYSGRGVVVNYANEQDPPAMPALYPRTLPWRPQSSWDSRQWSPEAVVIQLGSNDFWKEHPGAERFRNAYHGLLEEVRRRYPQAHILCLLASTLADSHPPGVQTRSTARALISEVVQARLKAGDSRVHFVEVPQRTPEEGLGCAWHASPRTNQRTAEQLTRVLRQLLGW